MSVLRKVLTSVVCVGLLCAISAAQEFDVLIKNGRVVDGTGNPWFVADVAVRDGVIAAIGNLSAATARRTVDARGRVVSPGFVDMMGTSSYPLLSDPSSARGKLYQGITTMLVGEGGSPAPQNERTQRLLAANLGHDVNWRTYQEYFDRLESKGVALNVIHNVGAGQIRHVSVGVEDTAPTASQMAAMKESVARAMQDGAVGISTALIYPPGSYATTEELIELSRVAAEYGGVYFTHMRNESAHLLGAIGEAIRIGEEARIPVHIYHLKAAGQENWPLMSRAIDLIRTARARGVDVTADIYPYIRNGIGLGSFIHPRHYGQGADAFLPTLADRNVRATLRKEIETTADWENWYRHVGQNWDNVLIAQVPAGIDRMMQGLSVAQAAAKQKKDPWDLFFELVQAGSVSVNPKSMDEEQKRLALQADFVSICTDAGPTSIDIDANVHPRAFGAFPRVLAKYVREEQVVSLEEAIRKMSSLAANRLMLLDRGRLAPGMMADILIFDPARIQDTAEFTAPLSYATGIDYVMVNGQFVIDEGKPTDELPGKVLRHGRRASR